MATPEEIRGAFGEDPKKFFERYMVLGQFSAPNVEKLAKVLVGWVRKHPPRG
jgi:hypothetical protein